MPTGGIQGRSNTRGERRRRIAHRANVDRACTPTRSVIRKCSAIEDAMRVVRVKWTVTVTTVAVSLVTFVVCLILIMHYRKQSRMACDLRYMRGDYFKDVMKYCNSPSLPVVGAEGALLLSKDSRLYKLESVHTMIRHGDRSNLHKLPNGVSPKMSCKLTEDLTDQYPELKDFLAVMSGQSREPGQSFYEWDVFPRLPVCTTGSLTPKGTVQHVLNGVFFRDNYIKDHRLIDLDKFSEQVLVRCTNKTRTFQSATAFLFGLFPTYDLSTLTIEEATGNSLCKKDMSLPCHCPGIAQYYNQMSCHMQVDRLEIMNYPLTRHIYEHVSETMGVASNSLPTVARLLDISLVNVCHEIPLPGRTDRCIEDWVVHDMNELIHQNGITQVKTALYRRVALLKMIPLLQEIAGRMDAQIKGSTTNKFVLYSGHDTSIEPMAMALDFSDGHWPRYASRIVLELVSNKGTDEKTYYIRVLYDGKVVTSLIHFCRGSIVDRKLSLCPFHLFQDFVNGGYLKLVGASSYSEACAEMAR